MREPEAKRVVGHVGSKFVHGFVLLLGAFGPSPVSFGSFVGVVFSFLLAFGALDALNVLIGWFVCVCR